MPFIETELRVKAQTELRTKQFSNRYETYKGIINESNRLLEKSHYDIFLSHRKLDEELILGIRLKLEKEYGYKVYVDWVDDAQLSRQDVGKQTAETLRLRMKQSRCLMYAYTKNATTSKWMPWELGYMDGHKPQKSTVLPILNALTGTMDYGDQEYLNLYPPTTEETNTYHGTKKLYVHEETGKIDFETWLNRKTVVLGEKDIRLITEALRLRGVNIHSLPINF